MKEIKLTQGMFATVDDEDYDKLAGFKWHVIKSTNTYYAIRRIDTGRGRLNWGVLMMHRCIMGLLDMNFQIDHRDGNGLNNTKNNLRVATSRQNSFNRKKHMLTATSPFKGVFKRIGRRGTVKWTSKITVSGRQIYLGSYYSEIDAAVAYDSAASKNFGEFAFLNFPARGEYREMADKQNE